jgi:hypothetical protein
MGGGSGGSSGPTVQQQQLETQQAVTNANLNLEENAQRKSILNSMFGTRVFRGSALSRALRGNTPGTGGEENAPAPSRSQRDASMAAPIVATQNSLIDQRGSGNTAAGGAGASGGSGSAGSIGGYSGGSSSRGVGVRA